MKKELKICLAMGGGVSLGSFSGSALTEAIKQLILNSNYSKITIDGMSGASAGAISLGIMLRCLIDYKSILEIDGIKNQISRGGIVNKLRKECDFDNLRNKNGITDKAKQEDLIAIQLAQEIQKKIWVEELTAEKLFGNKLKDIPINPDSAFSLLDRNEIAKLAKKYITSNSDLIDVDNNRRILAKDRVIFACSLTNLVGIPPSGVLKAHKGILNKNDTQLVNNLIESTKSFNHSEMRVIDFIFEENIESDKRWIQIKKEDDDKNHSDGVFSINSGEAWATLAASGVACGAFPVAFEPVMLKRFKREYGDNWPIPDFDEIDKLPESSKNNSRFNEFRGDGGEPLDYRSINFPYVDGGTFNNEPIKEAFRIANYIDFNFKKKNQNRNYDRIILFVDPIVRKEEPSYNLPAYYPIKAEDEFTSFEFNSEINKAVSLIGPLISMLVHQGSIKEEHKIDDYLENLKVMQPLKEYLLKANISPNLLNNFELLDAAVKKIKDILNNRLIPLGTRSAEEFFQVKIIELARSVNNSNLKNITKEDMEAIFKEIKHLSNNSTSKNKNVNPSLNTIDNEVAENNTVEVFKVFLKNLLNQNNPPRRTIEHEEVIKDDLNLLIKAFFIILGESTLNITGKDPKAMRMAITPVNMKNLKIINLPGSEIQAFGGFASLVSRQYSFTYGRLCAVECLSRPDFINYYKKVMPDFYKNTFTTPIPVLNAKGIQSHKSFLRTELKELDFYSEKGQKDFVNDIENELLKNIWIRLTKTLILNWIKKIGAMTIVPLGLALSAIFSLAVIPFYERIAKWCYMKTSKRWIENVLNENMTTINISILSNKDFNKVILQNDGKDNIKSMEMARQKLKGKDFKYRYIFQLFLYEENGEFSFRAPTYVEKVYKDPNLNLPSSIRPPAKLSEIILEERYIGAPNEFKQYKCRLPALNRKDALNYSLKKLKFHINPSIEYLDMGDNAEWYFKENTVDLSKIFMPKSSYKNA